MGWVCFNEMGQNPFYIIRVCIRNWGFCCFRVVLKLVWGLYSLWYGWGGAFSGNGKRDEWGVCFFRVCVVCVDCVCVCIMCVRVCVWVRVFCVCVGEKKKPPPMVVAVGSSPRERVCVCECVWERECVAWKFIAVWFWKNGSREMIYRGKKCKKSQRKISLEVSEFLAGDKRTTAVKEGWRWYIIVYFDMHLFYKSIWEYKRRRYKKCIWMVFWLKF